MTVSINKVEDKFREVIEDLTAEFKQAPWDDRMFYGCWLAQTWYLVRHTPRYLALTAGKFGTDAEHAHQHALEHLREERDHDIFAKKDIEKLGFSADDFPELPQTTAIYQGQYYWIEMHGPTSHLGYALMLEGLAAHTGKWFHKVLLDNYGRGACKFIAVHSVDDVGHFSEGIKYLLSEGNRPHVDKVLANLEQSRAFYKLMLSAIGEYAAKSGRRNKSVA